MIVVERERERRRPDVRDATSEEFTSSPERRAVLVTTFDRLVALAERERRPEHVRT
ncbi:hypothetical protein [Umezawaea beigongshangensis]|uniref:hypothetical protein n=1 Tax=Umezawaea beigongshangensis TaxID=2780383 RepID=UPI0018F2465E|nr:hypothetical protein [Umezawaea beigongshangensis]